MVSVTQTFPVGGRVEQSDLEAWLAAVTAGRPRGEGEGIRRAATFALKAHTGQARGSGEPFLAHTLSVAQVLADLGLDHETLAAALLHDVVEDTGVEIEELEREFGSRIAALVDGVTKMKVIQEFQAEPGRSRREHAQAQSLRKMLLAMELKEKGMAGEVTGRAKHIYSIWRKMSRKGEDFERIFDVRAVRVLVNDIRDCYAALGAVHSLWQHVPGEFDDYIATPKENNYSSIHTAVIGPEGKTVEVQIRTHDMHRASELGVAAHWRYKEGARGDKGYDEKIAWLRTLLEWKDEVAEASDFVDQFKSEVFSERVYVFTPKGNIVDLPAGSTPLDFAYHIHTDVGHRCRGAKVSGLMVPLTYPLKTGDRVEVLTIKAGGPSRDWLSPHLGYLATSKARSKVAHWFKQQNYEVSVAAGRDALEREFHRLGLSDVNYEKLATRFGHDKAEDFLAALGRGDIKPAQITSAVPELVEPAARAARPFIAPRVVAGKKKPAGVNIQGVGNLLTRMAKCCNPVPGDAIVGFITRGQGVTIHRRDCANALRHHNENEERLIEVSWGARAGQTYPVEVEIAAHDRAGLLRDITGLLANEKINVLGVSTVTDRQEVAHMTFTLEIPDIETQSRILALIDQIPNVLEVRRRKS